MKMIITAAMVAVLFVSGCGKISHSDEKEAWNSENDPTLMGNAYKRVLSALPVSGVLDDIPWSDTYWPNSYGGIAWRWSGPEENGFTYPLKPLLEIQSMQQKELQFISPAEKYDIFVGNYSYPTVSRERTRTHANDPSWYGLCHGWAPAALLFREPSPVILASANGVQVPFGASDVKALLSYYSTLDNGARSRMLGGRCDKKIISNRADAVNPECRDVNAGSFHIILTNEIGIAKRGFVADINRDAEVWNQPIYGYSSKLLGQHAPSPGAARGTVIEQEVETTVLYIGESSPAWNAFGADQIKETVTYKYRLELDGASKIIGGEWNTYKRPDFLWNMTKPKFSGYYGKIKNIYEASISNEPPIVPTVEPTVVPTAEPTIVPTIAPTVEPVAVILCDTILSETAAPRTYAILKVPPECTSQNFAMTIDLQSGSGTGSLQSRVGLVSPTIVLNNISMGSQFNYNGTPATYTMAFFSPEDGTPETYTAHLVSRAR